MGFDPELTNVDTTNGKILPPEVRDPTTWPVLQHDGPNYLGLCCNVVT